MKTLFIFSEFGVPNACSITKFFSETPYEHKNAVVSYMKTRGTVKCVCGLANDVVSGEAIGTRTIIHDGEYSWTNDLIYYVEKYNLKLPDDFIRYVLSQTNN